MTIIFNSILKRVKRKKYKVLKTHQFSFCLKKSNSQLVQGIILFYIIARIYELNINVMRNADKGDKFQYLKMKLA